MLSDDEKRLILHALVSQALADTLGDVRDAETYLWRVLDVPPVPDDHDAWDSESAFRITKARADAAGLSTLLPDYAQGDDDEDE